MATELTELVASMEADHKKRGSLSSDHARRLHDLRLTAEALLQAQLDKDFSATQP